MKEKLQLIGSVFTLQEWSKCGNVSVVKYSANKNLKTQNTRIFRSTKHYSLLY